MDTHDLLHDLHASREISPERLAEARELLLWSASLDDRPLTFERFQLENGYLDPADVR